MKHLSTTLMPHTTEYARKQYFLLAPHGVTVEDLLRPEFWANHVARMGRHDLIEAVAEDGSFDVMLRVLHVEVGYAVVRLQPGGYIDEAKAKAAREFADAQTAARSKYEQKPTKFPCVDFKAATGWRVLGFNGDTVKQKLASEADAQRELEAYIKRSGKDKAAAAA